MATCGKFLWKVSVSEDSFKEGNCDILSMDIGIMISENDVVLLLGAEGDKRTVPATRLTIKVKGAGFFNTGKLIGLEWGSIVKIANKDFVALPPNLMDKIECIERKAQIIHPKDSAHIIFELGIKSGDVIVEAGIGSAALTIALAYFVAPNGKVVTYEIREDFAEFGRKNLENAGLAHLCEIRVKDITKGIEERNVDGFVLDIPNPWDAVQVAYNSLKVGGALACYSPTINQVEKTVEAMRACGFGMIKTFETLQREILVKETGTRPSFDMLGHTGYTTVARKIKK